MYKELYLTITNECQLRCPHCYKDDYGLSIFNLNDVKSIIEKYPDIEYIILYGGEPLLEKYTYKVIPVLNYLKENKKIVSCVSNLCFDELSHNQEVIIYGVDNLSTSWNPSRFTDEQYNKWLSNVKKISEKRDIHLLVTLANDLISIDYKEVYDKLEKFPFKTIKFEPYIGNDNLKPKNKDVDIWLKNFFELCLENNTVEKYTLFMDIIDSIKDNSNYGIFNRKCVENILTLKPNGEIINCPNMCSSYLENKKEKLNQVKYNDKCLKCEYFSFCNGSCPLLIFDDDYCCGYPELFKVVKNCINRFIHQYKD